MRGRAPLLLFAAAFGLIVLVAGGWLGAGWDATPEPPAAEVARVQSEADARLGAELERLRVEAEQAQRAQEDAQREADKRRDEAAQTAPDPAPGRRAAAVAPRRPGTVRRRVGCPGRMRRARPGWFEVRWSRTP